MSEHDMKFLDQSTPTGHVHECVPGTGSTFLFKSPQRLPVWLLVLFLLDLPAFSPWDSGGMTHFSLPSYRGPPPNPAD